MMNIREPGVTEERLDGMAKSILPMDGGYKKAISYAKIVFILEDSMVKHRSLPFAKRGKHGKIPLEKLMQPISRRKTSCVF